MQREPQPTFGNEPLEDGAASAPFVTRLGTVVGGGVLAAAASSLLAELRMDAGGSLLRGLVQWLALAAILTPVGVLVVGVLRRGRVGLRLVAGARGPLFLAAALWWAVLELAVLSVFGAVLRAKTHHHGLAGVTFALLALFSGLAVTLLAVRGVRMLLTMPPDYHRVAFKVASAAALVVVALVALRTSRAAGLHTTGALIDALALLAAAALASSRGAVTWRPLAIGGFPVAAAVLLLGFACVRSEPDLKELLAEGAPLQAWLLSLL
jgi:hypothetical protein